MSIATSKPLYSGKAKDIFETEDPNILRAYFRDSATAFNAQKKGEIQDKGKVNATISALLFQLLEQSKIKTHFVKQISDRELLVKKVSIIPLEIIVRNIAAGSLCKRLGIKEGKLLKEPIAEFSYKNDTLGDPLLTRKYITSALEITNNETIDYLISESLKINEIFKQFFLGIGIKVVDFKLEFGYDKDKNLILADELSPDNFRFWDAKTNEKLDKDRFREDLGNVEGAYQEMLKRVKEGTKQDHKFQASTLNAQSFKVRVQVLPKQDILDPQGQAVEKALKSLGFTEIKDVKIGKEVVFEIKNGSKDIAKSQVKEMCEKLLANPVIEDYKIDIN
ncbi:MAG: phosphoribosylaminoimidazolesuccinocarboxamide synthase [Candidatus Melainabacteria bacterium]|nr:phosphoribosylaminoimidazolesuccinocarboxamide synthase [Candidatus Melainabacteria bacterium]